MWVLNEHLLSAGLGPVIYLLLWLRGVWAGAFQGILWILIDKYPVDTNLHK